MCHMMAPIIKIRKCQEALLKFTLCMAILRTSMETGGHGGTSSYQRMKRSSRPVYDQSNLRLNGHLHLLKHVERIATDNTVILAQASCGYLDFADNWIMHLQILGISNYLVIADDDVSFMYLNSTYPGHVVLLPTESEEQTQGRSFVHIRTQYFNDMMCERLLIQKAILEGGFSFVWSDMDIVWFQDVSKIMPEGFDFVGVDDAPYGYFHRNEQESNHVCGCMTYWAPTSVSKDVLQEWHSKCINGDGDDQAAFARWWGSGLKEKLRWYIMPRQLFPSGALMDYVKVDFTSPEDPQVPRALLPAAIHANHRVGPESKRKFLKERLAWKITPDQEIPICVQNDMQ